MNIPAFDLAFPAAEAILAMHTHATELSESGILWVSCARILFCRQPPTAESSFFAAKKIQQPASPNPSAAPKLGFHHGLLVEAAYSLRPITNELDISS